MLALNDNHAVTVFIGYDSAEQVAYNVCEWSLIQTASRAVVVRPLILPLLEQAGFMTRKYTRDQDTGQRFDEIDGRPFSTEFAFSRFLVPHLMGYNGLAVFCDCDMFWRRDVYRLIEEVDPGVPVSCVQHDYRPSATTKMDGLRQEPYPFKNWSSLMVFNCVANTALTKEVVNTWSGRDLHSFRWIPYIDQIGRINGEWNHLVTPEHPRITIEDPAVVHYTEGGPWHRDKQYHHLPWSEEWYDLHLELYGRRMIGGEVETKD